MKLTELSELTGVSRAAITQAVKRGLLVKDGNEIDPHHPKTIAYINQAGGRRREAVREKASRPSKTVVEKRAKSAKTSEPKEKKEPKEKQPSEPPTPIIRQNKETPLWTIKPPEEPEGETYDQASLREKIERADKLALENKQKRSELIEVKLLHAFLSRLYAIDTSQFLTRGDRIAATCAGAARAAGSDDEANIRVNDLLTADAFKEQEFKKAEIRKFLKSLKMKDDMTV